MEQYDLIFDHTKGHGMFSIVNNRFECFISKCYKK